MFASGMIQILEGTEAVKCMHHFWFAEIWMSLGQPAGEISWLLKLLPPCYLFCPGVEVEACENTECPRYSRFLCYSAAVGAGVCPGWSEAAGHCLLNAKGWGDRERGRERSSAAVGCDQGRFNTWCIQRGRGRSLYLASAQQEDVTRRHRVRS